ncbi:MAG: OsmC family peroxiredoxin, partial [Rhodococcus sp. (in: high G+C Gram-positive bacteria)]|nr:OsmC family peroxiredoxin [Rhodococcus sp. (in: high G+C Gram-positive bacteria)]MDX5451161.1 OsmC family peroxiredoxin [Rhodococcus sp. (in: high G+C Gram-positive bacteria)]
LDLSELDEEAQRRLVALVERSVDKVCTVGRTLEAGTEVTLNIVPDA